MKRLIMSGIPCADRGWKRLFPAGEGVQQKIVTFFEIFSKHYNQRNLFDLVFSVKNIILDYEPDEIVLHDISVTLGLLALIKIKKSNNYHFTLPSVIIFNGAFRGFNVFKASHPLRVQIMSFKSFQNEVISQGGDPDSRFKLVFSDIRHLYCQITIASVRSIIRNFRRRKLPTKIDLGCKILLLASRNDPYVPFSCIKLIARDFYNCKFEVIDYGHFPYAGDIELIRQKICNFGLISSETPSNQII